MAWAAEMKATATEVAEAEMLAEILGESSQTMQVP